MKWQRGKITGSLLDAMKSAKLQGPTQRQIIKSLSLRYSFKSHYDSIWYSFETPPLKGGSFLIDTFDPNNPNKWGNSLVVGAPIKLTGINLIVWIFKM